MIGFSVDLGHKIQNKLKTFNDSAKKNIVQHNLPINMKNFPLYLN